MYTTHIYNVCMYTSMEKMRRRLRKLRALRGKLRGARLSRSRLGHFSTQIPARIEFPLKPGPLFALIRSQDRPHRP